MAGWSADDQRSLWGMFRAYAATLSGDVPGTLFRHFFIKRLMLCRFSPRLIGRWLLMLSLSKHGQVSEFAGAGDIPRGTMPVAGRGMAVGLGGGLLGGTSLGVGRAGANRAIPPALETEISRSIKSGPNLA